MQRYLQAYQNKKTLSMEELWAIPTFLYVSLIEKIRHIGEKIYISQIQKHKVESIIYRLIDMKQDNNSINHNMYKLRAQNTNQSKYPFIEYMSYKLKKYGRKSYAYINILEEQVNKSGTTVIECINREHFDIAAKKISIGNSITTLNTLNRMNFMEIFDNINGVEEVLKSDPCGVYTQMDYKTKEYYRRVIERISKKTKISELYIAQKCVELANEGFNSAGIESKTAHVGYYLIHNGKNMLLNEIYKRKTEPKCNRRKARKYIVGTSAISVILSCLVSWSLTGGKTKYCIAIILFALLIIPIKNIITRIIQYISGKIVKPSLIPKIDFSSGIPSEYTTMVVIPTIVKNGKKVKEVMQKLEVYYMANKSENLYFTLLADCSSEMCKRTDFDDEIIKVGIEECNRLNNKYSDSKNNKFNFIYRERCWNEGENCYLGWERKRGLLNQFNEYLLDNSENCFLYNSFETLGEKPAVKYIITLDADTKLVLNTAFELVGAMAHILNKPTIDEQKNIVIDGYGLMQPRVGIDLIESRKTIFTKLFSGIAGTDSYTNAISDFYQDNFDEGIFTGKGIYDLKIFSKVLKDEIPENKVLSHDLLEGCYLRCGLVSDVVLMDGFPKSYSSYRTRLKRWIRGDYQIFSWVFNKKINIISKFKIFDNIIRSLVEAFVISLLAINILVKSKLITIIAVGSILFPYILDFLNKILYKKNGEFIQKKYSKDTNGYTNIFYKMIIELSIIPDKAWCSVSSGIKAVYRLLFSKKHLLEWTTSEEAEKNSKTGVIAYYKNMIFNVLFGAVFLFFGVVNYITSYIVLGSLWIIAPIIMSFISKSIVVLNKYECLNEEEKSYILEVGRKTWDFFRENLNEKSNYLPPDNYQDDRLEKIVYRTSPTNIGLALLSIVASYDLNYCNLQKAIDLIEKMIVSVEKLPKWNGHLYNWYNIKELTTLNPKYVSSVDSGNFVGYLYTLKQFLISKNKEDERADKIVCTIDNIINNTDFSKLFDEKNGLFSIGFNVEDNKLTDSYYDLLASEARQTSLVAIAKKDVPAKHWKNLSRALTILKRYKGLISWSGTAFEYLMPAINIKRYPNSLVDESCQFMIMSQMEYAKKLGITWGISEAAFNLKDFKGNYQYKAFGIPWLGLKRGLGDEMVVSSYGTVLAINDRPKEVVNNLKQLEACGMYNKYGFYESIDYTPNRVKENTKYSVVKTYMAHHQGLILLSIDNLVNNKIFQTRFFKNPEIEAVDILLQERMPDNVIITKEKKEKVEKIKYVDCDYYSERIFDKKNSEINEYNIISNNNYSILIDKMGNGYSKYKGKIINRYKQTDHYDEGILFFFKDIKTGNIWSPTNLRCLGKNNKYTVTFNPDKDKFSSYVQDIKTDYSVIVTPEDPVEIRKLELSNTSSSEKILEVSSVFEPVLSEAIQDYAHKAFNNMFISFENEDGIIVAKRRSRRNDESDIYMAITLYTEDSMEVEPEFELDKANLYGRQNIDIPNLIKESKPFSNKMRNTINPVISFRKSIKLEPNGSLNLALIIAVSYNKSEAIKSVKKYANMENIDRAINLSKAQIEAKIQYLGTTGRKVKIYQKILSMCLNKSGRIVKNVDTQKKYSTQELWKYGISGDNILIALSIKNVSEIDIVEALVGAYEYYKMQNIAVDLVIIDNEKSTYENYVMDAIRDIVNNHQIMPNEGEGRIYTFNNVSKEDKEVLIARSNLYFDGGNGKIEYQLEEIEYDYINTLKKIVVQEKNEMPKNITECVNTNDKINMDELLFYNEYGGFSSDGKEYIIKVNKEKKLPSVWSNILANKKFGCVSTEGMGGYTWYENSRLNRITAFSNDPIFDTPSEALFIEDIDSNNKWSPTVNPMPDNNDYYVKYGFGYSKYIHTCNSLKQEVDVFVPCEDSIKVNIIHLKNLIPQKRRIKLVYFVKLAMDEDEVKSDGFINIEYIPNSNVILAQNTVNGEFENYAFISSSEKINSYTGNILEFLGSGSLSNPKGINKHTFSNTNTFGNDNIIAINIEIELETLEHKDIVVTLGAEKSEINCKNMSYKYNKIENCYKELENTCKFWNDTLGKINVSTPDKSMNILLNGWLMYQTLSSRMFARSGFYQSGGAFGFRDQLQDSMCLKYVDSEYTKNQIIKHSKKQFIEGDVLHWWHDETKRGIRTKFSDDLLWLAYVTLDYIEYTGDYSILDVKTNYLQGAVLVENIDERYDVYNEGNFAESIYLHCIRAIKKACNFGTHGLPKIGSGDWNDGFSNVGTKGIGESVWLAFFLYDILIRFSKLCSYKNDIDNVSVFQNTADELKKNINNIAWDGRWFKRAFCDDGSVLGSIHNQECRIDGISQSWSVISKGGDNDKQFIAMESLENHLVDRFNGIIKLLDPPFENSNLNPGYIKSYLPGTRENGGQYTHAAIWAIIAETMLGFGNKAYDLFKMINPIEHSKTRALCEKYQVEPFVISADIYGAGNLSGVGGWTWYTGSSGWYYICAIKYILGINIEKGYLSFKPCIPGMWNKYEVKLKYGESIYNILFKNENSEDEGVKKVTHNQREIEDKRIKLIDDGSISEIEVLL